MLSPRGARPREREEKSWNMLGAPRSDCSEPIEGGEQAQAELASGLSEAFDDIAEPVEWKR